MSILALLLGASAAAGTTLEPAAPQSAMMPLRRLDQTEASRRGAVCLDGGAPGIYYRNASTPAAQTSWVLFFKGGGWCGLPDPDAPVPGGAIDDCATRTGNPLGNTSLFPPEYGVEGPLDPDAANNPTFAHHHHVVLWYCDGLSFSGDRAAPVSWPNPRRPGTNQTLYFRGSRVLDYVLDTLLSLYGMRHATELLVSGGSAGGNSAFVHADRIAARLPATTRVGAAPISGFFPMHAAADGAPTMSSQLRSLCATHNCTAGVHAGCTAGLPSGERWRCLAANYSYAASTTPFFPIQSVLDVVQLDWILNDSTTCAPKPTRCHLLPPPTPHPLTPILPFARSGMPTAAWRRRNLNSSAAPPIRRRA